MQSRAIIAGWILWSVSNCALARDIDNERLCRPAMESGGLECRHVRAGCPQCIAWYAHPSRTCRDTGYYVGGGAAFHGEPRCCDEGTWGWDYAGAIEKCIKLNWWHGRRYQGGTGAYRTDGPHLVHPH